MVNVYMCKLPQTRTLANLSQLLTDLPFAADYAKYKEIHRFRKIEDRYRTLIGDFLMRAALQKQYTVEMATLRYETNAYGKPFLKDYPAFHYNISHAGEWIVCAVHDQPVGVDIEQIRPIDLQIAKGIFTTAEYQYIKYEADEPLAAFYNIWTIKESYIKAVGKGLSIPLDAFCVHFQPGQKVQLMDTVKNCPITDYVCVVHLNSHMGDYKLAICARHAEPEMFCITVQELSFDTLCNQLSVPV